MQHLNGAVLFQSRNRDAFQVRTMTVVFLAFLSGLFQSRNRDAFQFRSTSVAMKGPMGPCFNLAIEMLFSSGNDSVNPATECNTAFQSRNRDAFQFRSFGNSRMRTETPFQSRNRDAFQFRDNRCARMPHVLAICFNLAIEMLFSSGCPRF